jgi:hypothetical protein
MYKHDQEHQWAVLRGIFWDKHHPNVSWRLFLTQSIAKSRHAQNRTEPKKQGPTHQFPRTLYQSHFLLENYHMSYSMEREKTNATKQWSILKHRDGWRRYKHVDFIGQKMACEQLGKHRSHWGFDSLTQDKSPDVWAPQWPVTSWHFEQLFQTNHLDDHLTFISVRFKVGTPNNSRLG